MSGNIKLLMCFVLSLVFSVVFLSSCDNDKNEQDANECENKEADAQCFLNGDKGTSGTMCDNGILMYCGPSVPEYPTCVSKCECQQVSCSGECYDLTQNGNAECVPNSIDGDSDSAIDGDDEAVSDGDAEMEMEMEMDLNDGDDVEDGDLIEQEQEIIDGDSTEEDMEEVENDIETLEEEAEIECEDECEDEQEEL